MRDERKRESFCNRSSGCLAVQLAPGKAIADIKPDNVLVSSDGRPRVADFGLARTKTSDTSPQSATDGELRTTEPGTVWSALRPESLGVIALIAHAGSIVTMISLWERAARARERNERLRGCLIGRSTAARRPTGDRRPTGESSQNS